MKMHIYKETDNGDQVCYFEGEMPCFHIDSANHVSFYKDKNAPYISNFKKLESVFTRHEIKDVETSTFTTLLDKAQKHRTDDAVKRMLKENPFFLRPYREGVEAAEKGITRENNPYDEKELESDFWDAGFFHRSDY